MDRRQFILGAAGSALAAATCSCPLACARGRRGDLVFAVGGQPAELEFWKRLAAEFEFRTSIRVELHRQPSDTDPRRQGLVIALQAGQARPDVFLMDVAWLAQLAASGWLEDLSPLLGGPLREDQFVGDVVASIDRLGGALAGLPVFVDGGVLYYRTDLLEAAHLNPPQTWIDLLEQSLRIQAEQRHANPRFSGFVWPGAQYEGLICMWLEVSASGGGGLVDAAGRLTVDQAANVQAAAYLAGLIRTHRVSPPNTFTEMREEQVREAFQRGDALFERNWPYAWRLHEQEGSPVRGRVGAAPLPHWAGGQSVSAMGGWHVGVNRRSLRKQQALRLVEHIVSVDVQRRLAIELGWSPGRREPYSDADVLRIMPHFAVLRGVYQRLLPRTTLPYYTLVSQILQRRLHAAITGRSEPAAALALAQREIEDLEARYERT